MTAGQEFCGEDWLRLKEKYVSHNEEDLLRYCFSSAYIVAMLHDSLGIALDDERYSCFLFKVFEYIEVDNIIGTDHLVPFVHETNILGQKILITSSSLLN